MDDVLDLMDPFWSNHSAKEIVVLMYSQTSLIRPHWSLDNFGRIKNSWINQKSLYNG